MCSTPTGIKGKGTAMTFTKSSVESSSAQRLQASKVKAPSGVLTIPWGNNTCSTPTGIKGKGTATMSGRRSFRNLCSTPTGIKGKGTYILGEGSISPPCAQRLQASKVKAQVSQAPSGCYQLVLNAYRHQR